MEIVLVNTAMPFGPDTISKATLGGSETAVLMAAKELKKRGHTVNVFTPLPPQGRPDHIPSGYVDEDGVRYLDIEAYGNFIGNTEVDLLIVCRDPRAIATSSQAKKRVLWMHDIATHTGMAKAFEEMQWTFDEVWTVSEFHRQQVHEVTGYPLHSIVALRNGIVPVEVVKPPFRLDKTLVYAARPERGLANLLREGGIMENLPDYTLKLAFYENTHESMRDFYQWCYSRVQALPNVEAPQPLPQTQMRQWLADATAYIYPTQFEETSCILARECIEQGTPFFTTREGALPETLGDCGLFFEDYANAIWEEGRIDEIPENGSPEWCKLFADFVRCCLETDLPETKTAVENMAERTDLYWDGVAKMMEANAEPAEVNDFSRAYSLVMDGDVVPAKVFLENKGDVLGLNWAEERLLDEIHQFYPFLHAEDDPRYETLAGYYKRFYAFKDHELSTTQETVDIQKHSPRMEQFRQELSKLADGSLVVEYGCGEGHVVVPLAQQFPNLRFVAFDQVQTNVDHVLNDYGSLPNVRAYRASTPHDARICLADELADAVICVEVLEHCERPWEVATGVEDMCKLGGRVIINTPFGPWEPQTFKHKANEYQWRNHIWHFDKDTIREMFRDKPDMMLTCVGQGVLADDGRGIGNYLYSFTADHVPLKALDPIAKALRHNARQTVAAAVIAYNNEDTIRRMLNSLSHTCQIVQIAAGPCTDRTYDVVADWERDNPHVYVNLFDVPRIEAPAEYGGTDERNVGFGFDDARNASTEGLDDITDWTLWIDTDEYLAGNIGVYLRNNCLDAYIIPQHHFTVEPRGGAVQIDRPARLFKNNRGYMANGHIHEHFELPEGGPGHCHMLPNVDIGHTGYVNEEKRRSRFERNFPFLVWEHETDPDRKLHAFLWFRDIVHRMRYANFAGDKEATINFAMEADDWFKKHRKSMANFGAGLPTAMQYIGEVRKVLGKGVEMEVGFKFDDRQAGISGVFLDKEELYAIMDDALDSEFKRRTSRYY